MKNGEYERPWINNHIQNRKVDAECTKYRYKEGCMQECMFNYLLIWINKGELINGIPVPFEILTNSLP